jgi:hypothetical protein
MCRTHLHLAISDDHGGAVRVECSQLTLSLKVSGFNPYLKYDLLAVRLVQLVSSLGAIAPVCPSLLYIFSIRWQTGPKRRQDILFSKYAFKFNLYRYITATRSRGPPRWTTRRSSTTACTTPRWGAVQVESS